MTTESLSIDADTSIGLTLYQGQLLMYFDQPVAWVALSKDGANTLAQALLSLAEKMENQDGST